MSFQNMLSIYVSSSLYYTLQRKALYSVHIYMCMSVSGLDTVRSEEKCKETHHVSQALGMLMTMHVLVNQYTIWTALVSSLAKIHPLRV